MNQTPKNNLEWLDTNPPLKELCARYPEEWESVESELADAFSGGSADSLRGYVKNLSVRGANLAKGAVGKNSLDGRTLSQLVRNRMAQLAVKQHLVSVATGVDSGKVRFNLLNGLLAQMLLFRDALERKPASMFWFRLLWPLVWQKRILMPLVQPKGIYCFYSRELIAALAKMIGARSCLEIAAGDGTLSRFLSETGVKITATDDYSWQHAVTYPETVIRKGAQEALGVYNPEAVICSWPPAGNSFEKQVFRTRGVQLYIVIGSRHHYAAGNWGEYKNQTMFTFSEEKTLSRLVLPPELDGAVYVFKRI